MGRTRVTSHNAVEEATRVTSLNAVEEAKYPQLILHVPTTTIGWVSIKSDPLHKPDVAR